MQDIQPILSRYLNNTCSNEERLFVECWYNSIGSESEMSLNVEIYLEKKLWRRILHQLNEINDHKTP
jgi:hypothetical protein